MTLQPQHITEHFINTYVKPGNVVVDATAGNGNDTLKLCRAVTETGKVFSFDIQESALRETKKKIAAENFSNAELICDSHSNMELYITNKVDCVVFNLGYLPGGDHSLQTKYTTTIEAIEKQIAERDEVDRNKKIAPLVVPDGAVVIDSTNLTIDEVVQKICFPYQYFRTNRSKMLDWN